MLYPLFLKSANSWAHFLLAAARVVGSSVLVFLSSSVLVFLSSSVLAFLSSSVLWFFDSLGLLESAGSHHTPLGVWIAHFFDISYLVLPCESDELSKCNVSK